MSDEERKRRNREHQRKRRADPETRAHDREMARNREVADPEKRERINAKERERRATDPQWRERDLKKQRKNRINRLSNPQKKERTRTLQREHMRKMRSDTAYRKRQGKLRLKRLENPEYLELARKKVNQYTRNKYHSDPQFRELRKTRERERNFRKGLDAKYDIYIDAMNREQDELEAEAAARGVDIVDIIKERFSK